ncbi:beta-ketoacyl synthase N-terminal-like domain-containing protein [Nocardia sp. NPDC060249]|uniref:beta-ketoacyl synthase N-terminal-like domain-containing protein n=1 Tax=Nocardia sp. NPDC060249 TaxID=3347082 RepID=UPI00365101EA
MFNPFDSGDPCTLVELINYRADRDPDRVAYRFLEPRADDGFDSAEVTFQQLRSRVRAAAATIADRSDLGDRVVLLAAPGLDYIVSFFGCIYAGRVPVPAYPPTSARHLPRLFAVVRSARAQLLICDQIFYENRAVMFADESVADIGWLSVAEFGAQEEPVGVSEHAPMSTSAAFLQYTSGSTSDPKGVIITHENILANAKMAVECFGITAESVCVSWLPPYHDMGLIGGIIFPLFAGISSNLLSPLTFVRSPEVWLQVISKYRATHSPGPNFAYKMCSDRISPEIAESLDLSSWTHALCGAEPVDAAVLNDFADRFTAQGFRGDSFYPCYGMAETTLVISGGRDRRESTSRLVSVNALAEGLISTPRDARDARSLVSSGWIPAGTEAVVVDQKTGAPAAENAIGELWVRGPSVAAGYFELPEATAQAFSRFLPDGRGPYLATGDLGVIVEGNVYITGRASDLMIIRGRNVYPQDIELTSATAHVGVHGGRSAAFAIDDDSGIVLVQEVSDREATPAALAEIAAAIRTRISEEHSLAIATVVLLAVRRLPLTSSGKVRRKSARAMFLADELPDVLAVFGAASVSVPATRAVQPDAVVSRTDIVAAIVAALVGELGCPPESIDTREPFTALGLDSVKSVQVAQNIATATGFDIAPTLLWEHPTVEALADALFGGDATVAGPHDAAVDEPVAVVGMGCRFPGGVTGVDEFWELLVSGGSGISVVPTDRWSIEDVFDADPAAAGRTYSRHGGFVSGVDEFDAALFGIAPREAAAMDPQHRLMLEVAWEALEHSGIAPDSLRGSATGVFVGMAAGDYAQVGLVSGGLRGVDAYAATGNASNFGANRLSYALGLEGPSVVVDTACSSSLVALHLGCASIRSGESSTVLVGGVSVMASPATTVALSKGRMLSASGECRTFDAGADGYVRGEGCGVVVLKRLSAAIADGDRVLAVIRGSAVNQDGRSNGLTAPNGRAQHNVVRAALRAAGVEGSEVGYVEAHGTGTPLGDPIEVRALAAALGNDRSEDSPLVIGSVKTNIGHLEAAAGIAGLIKTVLVMERGVIPPHRNLVELNPHVDWSSMAVRVVTEVTAWPGAGRVAGVSSFGFGGTNAHAIVGAAPERERPGAIGESGSVAVKVSGNSVEAIRASAGSLADFLARRPEVDLTRVAWAANVGRADLAERAAVVAATRTELLDGLRALAAGGVDTAVLAPTRAAGAPPKIAFVVPGHGAGIAGVLHEIYGTDPVVTRVVDEIVTVTGLSLSVLTTASDESRDALRDTRVAQPALYAAAVALGMWWRARGVEPGMIVGHSVGAYAAAALAGVFSATDGARIITERARLVDELTEPGRMAVVKCARRHVEQLPQVLDGTLAIAVANGPDHHVVSGSSEVVASACELLTAQGIEVIELPVTRAFHSSHMDQVSAALPAVIGRFALSPPTIAMISDTSGEPVGPAVSDPAYWAAHTRRPVDFAAALDTMIGRGVDIVVELGPGGLLSHVERAAGERTVLCVAAVAKNLPQRALTRALGLLWTRGVRIDWRACGPRPDTSITLPTYPFQRQRYWIGEQLEPDVVAPEPGRAPEPRRRVAEQPARVDVAARDQMQQLLCRQVAELMGVADDLSPSAGLFDLGLTSAMVVELRNQLESITGRTIPSTAVFDHPTIERLADYLVDLTSGSPQPIVSARAVDAPSERTDDHEPIAIIGLGCRFPGGANNPEAYWRLLCEGRDATSEVPQQRWRIDDYAAIDPQADIATHPIRAGFLDMAVDGFDADAFGIAPNEARSMDPQQRLLLEVASEALDDAGYGRDQIADSATGVFVGINTSDYMQRATAAGVAIDPYLATGNTFSVAAGRLSYHLGVRGPSMAIDTACSSSLVALHLAVRSLRSGEADAALVGGVNLMLSPATTVSLSKLNALSPDGRCKPFSAAADGYGRGEGCGVVVLKRLSDAQADGDRIWAVVRGSAVNQDGRSAGLTVPHGPSQHAVITEALRDGHLTAEAVGYVEAHGTGTPLGDPIEMSALTSALRPHGVQSTQLLVGSAKSNLGHLEAAAGIAGLIKVALMAHHRQVPATLHYDRPSVHIDWSRIGAQVATELTDWPARRPLVSGLSSFGFSGTNAHVVIEEAPATAQATNPVPADGVSPGLLVLSGRTDGALRATADTYRSWLRGPEQADQWASITRTAASHRPHHSARLALVARSAAEAADRLDEIVDTDSFAEVSAVVKPDQPPRLIFVFGGQGTQWAGMGASLLADDTARSILLRCEATIHAVAGWSLIEQLTADDSYSLLARTEIAQPAIVAVQIALVEMWRGWGVEPDAVVGHSIGEIAAAYCSGALTVEAALQIAVRRGRVMRETFGHGAMVVIGASRTVAAELSAEFSDTITLAAANSPFNTVLAGAKASVERVEAIAKSRGMLATRIQQDYAFHSYQMIPLRERLIGEIASIGVDAPRIAYYSTVTGRRVPVSFRPTADYWAENLSRAVLFHDALVAARESAESVTVVDISPNAVLRSSIVQSLPGDVESVASMKRSAPAGHSMLTAAAALHVRGHHLDHDRLQPRTSRRAQLPTYRWQRQRHWLDFGSDSPAAKTAAPDMVGRNVYDVHWLDVERVADQPENAGRWLVVGQPCAAQDSLVELLHERGASVVEAALYDPEQAVDGDRIREHVAALVAECGPVDGVIQLVAAADVATAGFDTVVTVSCAAALATASALAARGSEAKLWLLTSGAVEAGSAPIALEQAPVWGLGRVIGLEHPEIWGGLIDLDPTAAITDSLSAALDDVIDGDGEDQIAVRAGRRLVARLQRSELARPTTPPVSIAADRTYVITGGRGTLGLRIAEWLTRRGARELVLLGRSPLPESAQPDTHTGRVLATIERLRDQGVTVHTPSVDVADQTQMDQLFAADRPWARIAGVVHAAGAFTPSSIDQLDWPAFQETLTAKVSGTRVIEKACADAELDFLVLYSSGSSVWGSALAGHYAAANYYLDMTAHRRSRAGAPTYAINWGWFADSHMGAHHDTYFESMGLPALPDVVAFEALDRLIGSGIAQLTVASVDWAQFKPVLEAKRTRPLLAEFEVLTTESKTTTEFRASLRGAASQAARSRLMATALQRELAQVLGRDPNSHLDPDLGFFSAGMDSIASVALKRRLDLLLGISVPATAAFEHPTVNTLSGYLLHDVLDFRDDTATDVVEHADNAELEPLSADELLELLDQELENHDN